MEEKSLFSKQLCRLACMYMPSAALDRIVRGRVFGSVESVQAEV